MQPKKTIVYIDGFNLYYGILNNKNSGFKWLDLESWLSKLLPNSKHDIQAIKFFTAQISATPKDPDKPLRQNIYWRAINTLPKVKIIKGSFQPRTKKIRLNDGVSIHARIMEEKGTDVNLAAHAVSDGCQGKYDTCVIVSNDSDLAEVVRIITQDFKLEAGIINPTNRSGFSKVLTKHATFKKQARDKQILKSQFPATLNDTIGHFTKPKSW